MSPFEKSIKEAGESGLIKHLLTEFDTENPKVIKGIGDDAAVINENSGTCQLITTDVLVEGTHFSLTYSSPYYLGRKAISISLSDIAAMGGNPTYLLTYVCMSPSTPINFFKGFYRGLHEQLDEFGISLIGGNTSSSPNGAVLGTVMLGEVAKDDVLYRDGARVGDDLYVTGDIGDSAFGLKLLQSGHKIEEGCYRAPIMKHLDPVPRMKMGRLIAQRHLATAMTDISDGLLMDLRHICDTSKVGAVINIDKFPLSDALNEHISTTPQDIYLPLAGGEDYELLFTAPTSNKKTIKILGHELDIAITNIGKIVPVENGVQVFDRDGRPMPIEKEGFNHFDDI